MKRELETTKNIGKKIKILRKQNYLTQSQLAEQANLSINALAKAETGRISLSLNTLNNIAMVLNVDLTFFIFRNIDIEETGKNDTDTDIYLMELINNLNKNDKAFIIEVINALKRNHADIYKWKNY